VKVVSAGGSGVLGRRIADYFGARGHDIVILSADPTQFEARQFEWLARTLAIGPANSTAPHGADQLAGKLFDCRPTKRNIAELTHTRILPTRALFELSIPKSDEEGGQSWKDSAAATISTQTCTGASLS
jgi:uncharacterized protein